MTGAASAALAACAAAAAASLAAQEGARRAASAFGWRDGGGARPFSAGSAAVGWALCCAALLTAPGGAGGMAASGCAAVAAWYAAEVDRRDLWLPDHALLPLALAGLQLSPFAAPAARVDGLCLNVALAVGWSLAAGLAVRRRLTWEELSGGDVVFAGAMGAWHGIGLGQSALALAVLLWLAACACFRTRPEPPAPPEGPAGRAAAWTARLGDPGRGEAAAGPVTRTRLEAALGYDPEARAMPVGPCLAAAFALAPALRWAGLL